jgi:hypothetical protein
MNSNENGKESAMRAVWLAIAAQAVERALGQGMNAAHALIEVA